MGRGTERLEEHLGELLTDVTQVNGQPVRIARMDADSTRAKGALEQQLHGVGLEGLQVVPDRVPSVARDALLRALAVEVHGHTGIGDALAGVRAAVPAQF